MSVEQTDKNTTTDQWGAPRDFTPTVLGIATHCKNITFFGPKVRCLISILSLGWNFSVEGPQLPVASKSSLILKEGWCCLELELDWWAWAWSKKLLTEFSDSSICRAITPITYPEKLNWIENIYLRVINFKRSKYKVNMVYVSLDGLLCLVFFFNFLFHSLQMRNMLKIQ